MKMKITPRILSGTIEAMPSKSHAHRLLIARKLAELQGNPRKDRVEIPAFSDDIEATIACLSQMGKNTPYLECGESGSTLRFLLPVVMALKSSATFLGTGRLPDRPISPLKEEMERHGCRFRMGNPKNTDRFKEICTVNGRLEAGDYVIAGNVSSQFITGLLLALPLLEGDSTLTLTTELESAGYVEMTLDVLQDFGIEIDVSRTEGGFLKYTIPGEQIYREKPGLSLDGDWSNAAFWLAAGSLSGDITITGLRMESCQWDKEIVNILAQMGADLDFQPQVDGTVSIRSRASILKGTETDVTQIPDLTPILAVLMSFAEGTSMITHAQKLQFKESNRLKAIYSVLYNLDADISYGGDWLSFTGKAFLEGGTVDSFGDHRVAMAAAIASCLCREPIYLTNPIAVTKSYPDFYKDFAALGGEIEY